MAKSLHRLTVKQVENASPGASLNDGGGLSLRCAARGNRRWVFRFKLRGQSQREMGLGPFPGTTLAQARKKAAAARDLVAQGQDPIAEAEREAKAARAAAEAEAKATTFGAYADQFVSWKTRDFTNSKHIYQWRRTFEHDAAQLRDKGLADVTRDDILDVLQPIWDEKHVTAARVRGRLEALFDYAVQMGAYRRDNPARWRLFNAVLTKPRKLTKGHQPAMPWREVPAFVAAVRQRAGSGALALEFLILTATRSGEVRLAKWSEIDWDLKRWTIPAGRQKTRRHTKRRDHVVPLTERTVEILKAARALREHPPAGDDFIFPGAKPGQPLSDMTLRAVMRRLNVTDYVAHGFRSSFRDWAGSRCDFPRELAEEALAHALGDVEGAYRREQSVERRRAMMEAWEAHLNGKAPAEGNGTVVEMHPAAGA